MAALSGYFYPFATRPTSHDLVPLYRLDGAVYLSLTVTATSALVQDEDGGDFVAPCDGVVSLTADAVVWLAAGAAPTAVKGKRVALVASASRDFAVSGGQKIAARDNL